MLKAKKRLGQHFLIDKNICRKIASEIRTENFDYQLVECLEIGAGQGILTEFLFENKNLDVKTFEIDAECIPVLQNRFPDKKEKILFLDFLTYNIENQHIKPFILVGNLPYNISSQIFFKVLEHKNMVQECVFMIQKEVAQRIAAPAGNKIYGILSVFLQTFYNIEYLFSVSPNVFLPPPAVQSAVIRLTRNETKTLKCEEKKFFFVVKTAFNQRRKMLRNSLKSILNENVDEKYLSLRPENLTFSDFIDLTCQIFEK